jgi:hypothetical protein
MAKRKEKTAFEKMREERTAKVQIFEKPPKESGRYVKQTHYMLIHENYIKLSSSAKVLLSYMKDWAFASESYIKNGTFEYSTTMLSKMGVMSNKTQVEALNELQHYGFIQKENNARKDGGITQEWSFSCEWYNGVKGEYKKKYKPREKGEKK